MFKYILTTVYNSYKVNLDQQFSWNVVRVIRLLFLPDHRRVLTHSELAPLRVPLVPMEHCTSHFFQKCDADKDKQVSFKEWTSCFGIKNGEEQNVGFSDAAIGQGSATFDP